MNIKQLEKEIEEQEKVFRTLDVNAQKRLRKDFDRCTKTERLFIIEELKAKLQTLKQVCEEINKIECSPQDNTVWLKIKLLNIFQGEK